MHENGTALNTRRVPARRPVDFTREDIIAQVRALVAEQPERCYLQPRDRNVCSYVTSADTPGVGCLIGESVIACGLPREELEAWENARGGPVLDLIRWLNLDDATVSGQGVSGWLCTVQYAQDYGFSWWAAVARGDRYFPLD